MAVIPDCVVQKLMIQSARRNSGHNIQGSQRNVVGERVAYSREKALQRDMERLFTQRVQVFAAVKSNYLSVVYSILKVVFKAMVEQIRLTVVRCCAVYGNVGDTSDPLTLTFIASECKWPSTTTDRCSISTWADPIVSAAGTTQWP